MSQSRMMVNPFSVTYWIGDDSFTKQSGVTCLLLTAIAFTIKSATLFRQTIVNSKQRNEAGIRKVLKVY
jgi:hypothetical protein